MKVAISEMGAGRPAWSYHLQERADGEEPMPIKKETEPEILENRNRLRKKEGALIETRLRKMGYSTSRRGDGTIHAWEGSWACSFRWEIKKGWRLDISQPIIWSQHDLQTALDEIETTRHHRKLAEEAWRTYVKCRSDKAWRAYQGVMASHFARLGAIPTPPPIKSLRELMDLPSAQLDTMETK